LACVRRHITGDTHTLLAWSPPGFTPCCWRTLEEMVATTTPPTERKGVEQMACLAHQGYYCLGSMEQHELAETKHSPVWHDTLWHAMADATCTQHGLFCVLQHTQLYTACVLQKEPCSPSNEMCCEQPQGAICHTPSITTASHDAAVAAPVCLGSLCLGHSQHTA
jgi:hypothetical protein